MKMLLNFLVFGVAGICGLLLIPLLHVEAASLPLQVAVGCTGALLSLLSAGAVWAGLSKFTVSVEDDMLLPPAAKMLLRPFAIFVSAALIGGFVVKEVSFATWSGQCDRGKQLVEDDHNYKEGMPLLEAYTQRYPYNAAAWATLSYGKNGQHQYDAALTCARRSVTIDSHQVGAWSNAAWALNMQKKFADGLKYSEQAVKIDGNNGEAWCTNGDAHLGLGHYEAALTAFNRHSQLHSTESYGFERRALAHEALGHTDLAKADHKKAEVLESD